MLLNLFLLLNLLLLRLLIVEAAESQVVESVVEAVESVV